MRVTQSMLTRSGLQQLTAQRARLAKTQEQASSGLRINRPSDDPVDYRTTRFLKDSLSQTDQFLRSIDLATGQMRVTENAIAQAVEVVVRAKETAISARNATNENDVARRAHAEVIQSSFEALVNAGNTRSASGAYVFSGLASDTEAFVQTGTFTPGSGTAPTVAFNGDPSRIAIEIDEGVFADVTRNGQEVFQGTVDVFATLGTLWEGLDDTSDPVLSRARIDQAIGELDEALDQLLTEQARIGAEENKASDFDERLRLEEEEIASRISSLEDADVFEVYSNLTTQESALQATLQVNARLLGTTLLDYI